jgi:long-chain acyl-CoA synthetase
MPYETILTRLFARAAASPTNPAYFERTKDGWSATSYGAYAAEVRRAAKALIALGCEPKHTVAILGFNRPEWVVMDLACMAAGGAPAGIYTTCSPREVQYIVDHSGSPVVLVENAAQWEKIREERARMPRLRNVVLMRGVKVDDPLCMTWEEFLQKGDTLPEKRLEERLAALEPGGLATLIYTSGTTGPPKGVMLSHENLAWTAKQAVDLCSVVPSDRSLSYLPLSHIAEQMFSIHVPITGGSQLYFAENLEKVPDNLKEVQPTVFFGVPRIWEKFYDGIGAKLKLATGAKKALVAFARSTSAAVTAEMSRGRRPSGLLALRYKLASKLIFSKLKPAIGLGEARVCVSGAAPIATEILEFFGTLDLRVLEVYGQSEGSGPTSFNLPNRFRFGSVGPALAGVDVKIAEDGEILLRGPNVFLGYYKDDAATKETLVNGWLHSGDLGEFDRDGFLTITGRKKDILVTAGGKNIAPKNLESALKLSPYINEAVVIGDRRKFLTCLVTLEPEAAKAFAAKEGVSVEELPDNTAMLAEVQRAVDTANADVGRVTQIKKFRILKRNFTVDGGELTPTLKVKRNVVNEHFAAEIESMYAEGDA